MNLCHLFQHVFKRTLFSSSLCFKLTSISYHLIAFPRKGCKHCYFVPAHTPVLSRIRLFMHPIKTQLYSVYAITKAKSWTGLCHWLWEYLCLPLATASSSAHSVMSHLSLSRHFSPLKRIYERNTLTKYVIWSSSREPNHTFSRKRMAFRSRWWSGYHLRGNARSRAIIANMPPLRTLHLSGHICEWNTPTNYKETRWTTYTPLRTPVRALDNVPMIHPRERWVVFRLTLDSQNTKFVIYRHSPYLMASILILLINTSPSLNLLLPLTTVLDRGTLLSDIAVILATRLYEICT